MQRIMPEQITKLIRIVDTSKCLMCNSCEKSCAKRHGYQRNVRQGVNLGHFAIPHACKQCEDPQCIRSCKKGARRKDQITGAVHLDKELCIGCGLCAKKCPFQSISMEESGKFTERKDKEGNIRKTPVKYANSCDLCACHRKTGCFTNCPLGSLRMLPFNTVFLSLPPAYREKLKKLFLNGSWIREEEENQAGDVREVESDLAAATG